MGGHMGPTVALWAAARTALIGAGRLSVGGSPRTATPTADNAGRSVIRRSLPPCPPPTRRGLLKGLRLRAHYWICPRGGDGGRAGLEPAPTVFGIRFHSRRTGRCPQRPPVAGFGLPPMNAVRVAVLGDPRCDDIRCWLNGITFPIPRRGGPMCPPVRGCGTGTVPIKREMVVIGGHGPPWACARRRVSERNRREAAALGAEMRPVRRCSGRVNYRWAGRPGGRPLRRITRAVLLSDARFPPAPLLRGGGLKRFAPAAHSRFSCAGGAIHSSAAKPQPYSP